jgi:predicted nucleotidyltransferase
MTELAIFGSVARGEATADALLAADYPLVLASLDEN